MAEGTATRITERALLERLATRWLEKLDWHFDVVDGGFRDQNVLTAGGDAPTGVTAHVFAVRPVKVLAFGKGEPFSQTRYRFGRS